MPYLLTHSSFSDDNLLKELERVRTVRFDAEFALDLTLMDATILYRFGGKLCLRDMRFSFFCSIQLVSYRT